jgi:hypothetical protein
MDKKMTDTELAAHYENPANRTLTGSPSRRRKASHQVLSNHVPIRFSPGTMNEIQAAAHQDGMTTSAWIRWVVDQELARRRPPRSESTLSGRDQITVDVPSNQPATSAMEAELVLVA